MPLLQVPRRQPLDQHQPACSTQALDMEQQSQQADPPPEGPLQTAMCGNGASSQAASGALLSLHPARPHRVATLLAMAGCACTSHPTMSVWKALFRSVQMPQWGNPRVPPRGSRESSAAHATILRPCSRGSCAISSARGGLSRMVPSRSAGSGGAHNFVSICRCLVPRSCPRVTCSLPQGHVGKMYDK